MNDIRCIKNPLQRLRAKRRRWAKLQPCWKIPYLRRQQGCIWHLCLWIPKSQGYEEIKFQSKTGNVKLCYRRNYHISSLAVLVLPSCNAPTPLDQNCLWSDAQSWTLGVVCTCYGYHKYQVTSTTSMHFTFSNMHMLW